MSLYTLWIENDWVVKLMIIAVMSVTIIVLEKFYHFYKTYKALQALQSINTIDEVEQLPESLIKTTLRDIVAFNAERDALFDANIGVKLEIFEGYLMRYIPIVGLIAILSPMLGLIGTFMGVWHVFEGVSQVSLNDPALIAKGIKEVLIDTMAGLIVAVYAMIFYKSFEVFVQKMVIKFEARLYYLLKTNS